MNATVGSMGLYISVLEIIYLWLIKEGYQWGICSIDVRSVDLELPMLSDELHHSLGEWHRANNPVSVRLSFSLCKGRIQILAYRVGIFPWKKLRVSFPVCRMGTLIGCLLCTVYDGDCRDAERKDTTSGQTSYLVWWVISEDKPKGDVKY